jgi:hypothetical protein
MTLDMIPALMHMYAGGQEWWKRAAAAAYRAGHSRVIPGRNDGYAYLLRFWLTPPEPGSDQGFESGNSVLLHMFARGDDDQALHDHPWDFQTTILSGGYWEHLPSAEWLDVNRAAAVFMQNDLAPGPAWNERREFRAAGQAVKRDAMQLHCVGEVMPGTVTLVRTGPRWREWGFHPPGQAWVPYKQFLKIA